jgi:hypothetical protein
MKRILLTLAVVGLSALTMYGQGRVSFNNQSTFAPADAITIGALNIGAIGGNTGWGIGGDKYAVQLRWALGTFGSQSAFDAANPLSSGSFSGAAFLANTGDLASFSGFFDAGVVSGIGAPGAYTMQVSAWYNVGAANATYAGAFAAGSNVGQSGLFQVNVTASPTPVNSTVFPGFQVVAPIPEPSTFVLAGLGIASLLLFRRRK